MAETSTASSIGTEVTRILDEATVTAEELLLQADHQADRAGREELVELRATLSDRIDALGARRERLEALGSATVVRLREAASELAEIPARLAEETRDRAGETFLDRAFAEEEAGQGPPAHLVALMKAADSIAEDLAGQARRKTHQLEQAARREADRIASKEPRRLARAYDPTVSRAQQLQEEAEALSQVLAQGGDHAGGPTKSKKGSNDERGPDERWRANAGGSWKRR
jgi:hypothetical protein